MSKKALLIFPYFPPDPGAAAARGEAYYKYLQPEFETHVITKFNGKFDEYQDLKNVARLDLPVSPLPWKLFKTISQIRKQIKQVEPDLVVASAPNFLLAAAGCFAARSLKVPVIADIRDQAFGGGFWKRQINKSAAKYLFKNSQQIFVTTKEQKDLVVKDYGVAAQKVKVVSNGIDLELYPQELPTIQHRPTDILFVGSINPERNLPELVNFCVKITELRENIKIKFVGVDRQSPSAISFMSQLQDFKNIEFIEEVSHQQAKQFTTEAKIGLVAISNNPQLEYMMPVKVFEYMAGGAVVAGVFSDSSKALKRIFNELQIGIWNSKGSKLAMQLDGILDSSEKLQQISEANIHRVKGFSRAKIINNIKDEITRISQEN